LEQAGQGASALSEHIHIQQVRLMQNTCVRLCDQRDNKIRPKTDFIAQMSTTKKRVLLAQNATHSGGAPGAFAAS
jgi:hypothetical protein